MIKIKSDLHTFMMSPKSEINAYCESGDIVVFETLDCFSNKLLPEGTLFGIDNPQISNPATGPLYINGAQPGDTLKIEVVDIQVGEVGIFVSGPVDKNYGQFIDDFRVHRIRVENDEIVLSPDMKVAVAPMIGVIGVATVEGIPTALPGIHGGNLDCKDISKGATIYLPVLVEGGLLSIGDLHAIMGAGETGMCGLEIEGVVTTRISLEKKKTITSPRIETQDYIEIIGLGETLESACDHATQEMLKCLIHELNMDKHEAAKIIALCGDLIICQVVNEVKTVAMRVSKKVLTESHLKGGPA